MKKFLLPFIWFPVTLCTVFIFSSFYLLNPSKFSNNQVKEELPITNISKMPYKFYASLPEVLGAQTVNDFSIKSKDIIPDLVYKYLKKYKSPMSPTTESLVETARKYDIDPLFMVAIAQCESNLGKKMPYSDEENKTGCHNPFGWGIHKGGALCFNSWEEGYEAVAKGLRTKYYDKGLTNPEEIMVIYTPPALEKDGSWAKCINKFLQELNKLKEEI